MGALVDRRRRRPLMVATDLTRAALLTAIPVAWAVDVLSLPLLLVIVTAFGTASLVNDAASMSFLPRLVPGEHLQRAHARLDGADAVAQTSGPALAGVLVGVVGAPLAVLVNSATYLMSAVTVATLGTREQAAGDTGEAPHLRREIKEGVRWVVRTVGADDAGDQHPCLVRRERDRRRGPRAPSPSSPWTSAPSSSASSPGWPASVPWSARPSRRRSGARSGPAAPSPCRTRPRPSPSWSWPWPASVPRGGRPPPCSARVPRATGGRWASSNSHEMSYRQRMTPDALQARVNTTMRSFNRAVVVVVAPLAGLFADQVRPAPGARRRRRGLRAGRGGAGHRPAAPSY